MKTALDLIPWRLKSNHKALKATLRGGLFFGRAAVVVLRFQFEVINLV